MDIPIDSKITIRQRILAFWREWDEHEEMVEDEIFINAWLDGVRPAVNYAAEAIL